MKEYVITLDCNGLKKQIKIIITSKQDAIAKAKQQNPNCNVIDCEEYLKS